MAQLEATLAAEREARAREAAGCHAACEAETAALAHAAALEAELHATSQQRLAAAAPPAGWEEWGAELGAAAEAAADAAADASGLSPRKRWQEAGVRNVPEEAPVGGWASLVRRVRLCLPQPLERDGPGLHPPP